MQMDLEKLGEAIQFCLPLEQSTPILQKYEEYFNQEYNSIMRKKLGLLTEEENDVMLFKTLFDVMHKTSADMTNTFRKMNLITVTDEEEAVTVHVKDALSDILKQCSSLADKIQKSTPSISETHLEKVIQLEKQMPGFLQQMGPQGEQMHEQLQKYLKLRKLKDLTQEQLDNQNLLLWTDCITSYSERIIRDCKGKEVDQYNKDRISIMNKTNPRFILRNYLAEKVIRSAKKGNYEPLLKLQEILRYPFADNLDPTLEISKYDNRPPEWAADLCVTCSS